MLKLYRLNPKVGQRKEISATSVKNEMYKASMGEKTDWKNQVPESVAEIIKKNWNVVEEFASSEDKTMRVLGMKFPREGYN
jgi:ATP:corrinoid adenosyltransferase